MTELQRLLEKRFHRCRRLVLLAISLLTFGAALIITVRADAARLAGALPHPALADAFAGVTPPEPVGEAPGRAAAAKKPRLSMTRAEKELLARAVYSEARGEEFRGQVAVAAVILNRVEDPDFPDDVAGVIFQPQAFTAVSDGQFWMEPDQEAYRAVQEALEGKDPSRGALYYYNPAKATSSWVYCRPVIVHIGRHIFAG